MGFELPNGKTARNLQEQVKFLSEKLKELIAFVNQAGLKSIQIVEELPEVGDPTILYLLAKDDPESGDYYDEYLWIDDAWELIGTTQIDLSDYMTLSTNQTATGKKTFKNQVDLIDSTETSAVINSIKTDNDGNLLFLRDNTYYISIGSGSFRMKDRHFLPGTNNSSYSLGSFSGNSAWKDLYLSGKSYFGDVNYFIEKSGSTLSFSANSSAKMQIGQYQINVLVPVKPNASNTVDLGASDATWKDLYLSGNINFPGNASQGIYNQIDSRWIIRFDSGNGIVDTNYPLCPFTSNTYDLGLDYRTWRNLYLSGKLSDGTNSIAVKDIGKKLYKHRILLQDSSSKRLVFSFICARSAAFETASISVLISDYLFYWADQMALDQTNSKICYMKGQTITPYGIQIVDTTGTQSDYYPTSCSDTVVDLNV